MRRVVTGAKHNCRPESSSGLSQGLGVGAWRAEELEFEVFRIDASNFAPCEAEGPFVTKAGDGPSEGRICPSLEPLGLEHDFSRV